MNVTRDASLPRLAWAAHVPVGGGEAQAYVGDWVETAHNAIFEGAWNGDFGKVEIAESYSFMGSGLLATSEGVTAVAPCNTMESIYSYTDEQGFSVSNSVACLLEMSGQTLDTNYLGYESDALSISGGLSRYYPWIPLRDGSQVRVHYYCNVEWSPHSGPMEVRKPIPAAPSDYAEYRQFLSQEMRGVNHNATHRDRRVTYRPIVFCSTGYDSTACAVLGRELGCDEAVVYESKKNQRVDAGTRIVENQGYSTIHKKHELDYLGTDLSALFTGSRELGTSIFFASSANELTGKLLLSGAHGDKMWGREHRETDEAKIVRSPYPDTAKSEFRLHIGFMNYPVPFLTAMIQPQINDISNNEELQPWRMNNDYDRPIPRRIAEDAGVPRDAFGVGKEGGAGSSLRFGNIAYLKRVMPPSSYGRFEPFWQQLKKRRRRSGYWALRASLYMGFLMATWLELRGSSHLRKALMISRWSTRATCSPFAPSGLFLWAVHELRSNSYKGYGDVLANH